MQRSIFFILTNKVSQHISQNAITTKQGVTLNNNIQQTDQVGM